MQKITIDQLIEEQKKPTTLAVIQEVTDDRKHVRVTPWNEGTVCFCGKGTVVLRSAIKEIKKIGRTVRCCGKTLQVVEVTFAEGKQVSYAEFFSAVQNAQERSVGHGGGGSGVVPVALIHRLAHKIAPPRFGGGGGSGDDIPFTDFNEQCIENCVARALADASPAQRNAAEGTFRNICAAICGASMGGGFS